jgi:hypothetical protein
MSYVWTEWQWDSTSAFSVTISPTMLICIYLLLLAERQTGEAWESSNFGKLGALEERSLALFHTSKG